MTNGMIIDAANRFGTMRIEAGEGATRTYTWNNHKETIQLLQRRSRVFGSLGLYHPGGGDRVHLVVQEGQQHFCSEAEAVEWLLWKNERFDYVYTSQGLVVGWYSDSEPKAGYERTAVSVELWQFYIAGHKPIALERAANERIRITFPETHDGNEIGYSQRFIPSQPQVIEGRLYAGKALDYMKEFRLSPKQVERAITRGESLGVTNTTPGWKVYWLYTPRNITVVVLDASGRVVRVQN